MSAAVLDSGGRSYDYAFARLLPKPQGVDRFHDRLEYLRGNPSGKNALTNLFASCNRVFGTGEQRVERVERGSDPHVLESVLKSIACDDKTGWNAMSKIDEAAQRSSFAAKQAGIGCAWAEHFNVLRVTHHSAFQSRPAALRFLPSV